MSSLSSALSGAATGASLGTAVMPGPGTAVGAAIGGIGGAIAGRKPKIRREWDKQLDADIEAMKAGKLGLSAAERDQLMGEATRGVGSQTVNQQAQIARESLAGTDPGTYAAAQRAVSEGSGEGIAQASSKINDLSARIAEQKRNEIMQRMGVGMNLEKADRAESKKDLNSAFDAAVVTGGAMKDAGYDPLGALKARVARRAGSADAGAWPAAEDYDGTLVPSE